jgi:hypothetical protein
MTSIFYNANGSTESDNKDIRTIENMATISDIFNNSIKGNKIRLLQPRNDALNIAEITFFDENNIEIPKNTITTTQSSVSTAAGSWSVKNSIDENNASVAATKSVGYSWFEFDLGTEKNISRIHIFNRLDTGEVDINRIKDAVLQIIDKSNKSVFEYKFDNNLRPSYNIFVKENYNYVIGRHIKIVQQNSFPINLTNISIFNSLNQKIPSSNITITQSSLFDATKFPSNNLIDNDLTTFSSTIGLKNDWINFDLRSDMKISRIIINSSNQTNWTYNFGYTSSTVYDIEINNPDWEIYKNEFKPKEENYTAIKKLNDNYYCMSIDSNNCLFSSYTNTVKTLTSNPTGLKNILINKEFMPNTMFKKEAPTIKFQETITIQKNINNLLSKQKQIENATAKTLTRLQEIENKQHIIASSNQDMENQIINLNKYTESEIERYIQSESNTNEHRKKTIKYIIGASVGTLLLFFIFIIIIKTVSQSPSE